MKSATLAIASGAAALVLPVLMVGCSAGVDGPGEVGGDNGVVLVPPDPSARESGRSATPSGETEKLCGASRDDWFSTKTVHNGNWGTWGCADFCPPGSYVYGIDLKSEVPQGSGDDTAVNAISGWCFNRTTGQHTEWVTSTQGPWGSWLGLGDPPIMCSNAALPIAGVRLKVEAPQGGSVDDTSANSLKFACLNSPSTETEVRTNGRWGSWGSQVLCDGGTAVCGLQTRVEAKQGSGDDTALNGLKVFCCSM
jgi:hypothetical protein